MALKRLMTFSAVKNLLPTHSRGDSHTLSSPFRGLRSGAERPVTRWHAGRIAFSDSWSVLLRNKGFLKNHDHSHDWLSSALCRIVPAVVSADGKEGWIKLGGQGFRARESLDPDYWLLATGYWLLAEESALAIFPSYLRHGTESLLSDVERMTLDIDALPSPT